MWNEAKTKASNMADLGQVASFQPRHIYLYLFSSLPKQKIKWGGTGWDGTRWV